MRARTRDWTARAALLALAAPLTGCQLLFPTDHFEQSRDASTPRPDASDSAADHSAGGWCSSRDAGYLLCSDFDEFDSVTHGFDLGLVNVPGGVGGDFSFDAASYVSPPRSALAIAYPFPAGLTSGAHIVGTLWPLGPTHATLSCALMWRPVKLSTTPQDFAHVFALRFYSDADGTAEIMSLSINMRSDGTLALLELYQLQSTLNATHPIALSVTPGEWYAVSLDLTSGNSTTTFQVKAGSGKSAGELASPLPATSHATFEFGPSYYAASTTSPSPGWSFGYDNVVCY